MIIKIDLKFIDTVLTKAGYSKHQTIYKGEDQYGYVKSIPNTSSRFHCFVNGDSIDMHIDITDKKSRKHRAIELNKVLMQEGISIKKIYKEIDPAQKQSRRKTKSKFKAEYAPNLMELQRRTPVILKQPWYSKLFKYISDLYGKI